MTCICYLKSCVINTFSNDVVGVTSRPPLPVTGAAFTFPSGCACVVSPWELHLLCTSLSESVELNWTLTQKEKLYLQGWELAIRSRFIFQATKIFHGEITKMLDFASRNLVVIRLLQGEKNNC